MPRQPPRPAPRRTRRDEPESEPLQAIPAQALRDLAVSVARARTPAEAVKDHLSVARDLVDARLAFVSTYDSARDVLAVAEVRGRTDSTVVAARVGEGPVGEAWSGRAIVGDPLRHLAVALVAGEDDKPYGVLSVVGARRQASPAVWRALAAHLVASVEAAEARDSSVRRARDLQTAVAGLKALERARDELVAVVSHELKSPLTTIKAYLALARQQQLGALTDRMAQAFEVCDRNSDRLLRLINDMLLMARLQGAQMKLADRPFGLRALCQEACGRLAPLCTGVSVEASLARGGEVFVKGDRDRLLDAVGHLLEHAVLHCEKGGRVELSLRAEGGAAVLDVADSARAIPEQDLPHVFDRFWRGAGAPSRAVGAGLSLAIVRQIAHLHGGSATVESRPGQGATFRLCLPLFAGAVGEAARLPERRDGAVLVVEDDADCREVVCQVLESEGLRAIGCPDAAAALAALETALPALVLLDLRLGEGDGRQVLQAVRHDPRLARIPVFVVSGAAEAAAGLGWDGPERIDGFFEKPLNLPRLLERVHEVVQAAPPSAAPAL